MAGTSVCERCGTKVDTISMANPAEVTPQPAAEHQPTLDAKMRPPTDATIDWKTSAATAIAVPGYEILREIGRGGMGVVYKAREKKLSRIVALKMILSGPYCSPDQLARFRTETQAVAQLQHPNVVQIYEVGDSDGRPYCAFEYMEGGSLATKVFHNPLPSHEAAQIVVALARAIHSAHQRGIVHRDLKPDNILLSADGTPKISDFGLAKRLETDSGQTQSGSILGTPSYMAPEQAAGNSRAVGPAADIWALGAILYYLLTGQPPFHGAALLDTLQQVRTADPVPPRRLRPKLSRDLETICLKCLEKDARSRYPSAEALADDLHLFLANEPIKARPISRWESAVRHVRRRPTTVALSGMLLVVAALFAGSLVWLQRAESSRMQASLSNKPFELKIPSGLPSLSIPSHNPLTEGRVELGKQLFFDKRLSGDSTVACATCHDPSKGWSNGKAFAHGVGARPGNRKAPSIVNITYQNFLFWDGRAGSLEEQALGPIQNPDEMAMPSLAELESRLKRIAGYRDQFHHVFGTDVTAENIGMALAAYQRTILSGNAPYDRHKAGEEAALSESATRGMKLFFGRAHCAACHSGPNFSDGGFHNIGVGANDKNFDVGRQKVSGLLGDRGSFKTQPSQYEFSCCKSCNNRAVE